MQNKFLFKFKRRKSKFAREKERKFLRKFNLLKRPIKRNPFKEEITPRIRRRVEKVKNLKKLAKEELANRAEKQKREQDEIIYYINKR